MIHHIYTYIISMTETWNAHLLQGTIAHRYSPQEMSDVTAHAERWRHLAVALLERPNLRQFHGQDEVPYWEASLTLPLHLSRPTLTGKYLAFYASPALKWPFWIGLLADTDTSQEDLLQITTMTGQRNLELRDEIERTLPALVCTTSLEGLAGLPFGDNCHDRLATAGECAFAVAQLHFQRILAR